MIGASLISISIIGLAGYRGANHLANRYSETIIKDLPSGDDEI